MGRLHLEHSDYICQVAEELISDVSLIIILISYIDVLLKNVFIFDVTSLITLNGEFVRVRP